MKPVSNFHALVQILLALLLGGCGATPVPQNPRQEQALQLNQRGGEAFRRGEWTRALALFQDALRLNQSLENTAGIATNRLNLARTYRAMNQAEQAHAELDALLAQPLLPYPERHLAKAAALQAVLYLGEGNFAAARQWIAEGHSHCRQDCDAEPSLLLLQGQLELREGAPQRSFSPLNAALARLQTPGQEEERSNALRLLGEAWLEQARPDQAQPLFEQALELDRKNGLPAKISLDLLRLGETHQQAGETSQARIYFHRAATVSRSGADEKGLAAAQQRLHALP